MGCSDLATGRRLPALFQQEKTHHAINIKLSACLCTWDSPTTGIRALLSRGIELIRAKPSEVTVVSKVDITQLPLTLQTSQPSWKPPPLATLTWCVPRQLKANPLVSPAQDTINLKAIGSFFLIKRIFSSSFCTHTYPAFLDNDHTIPYEDFPISLTPKSVWRCHDQRGYNK
ncbi:uncharacterized protein BKA55DRAFT_539805 [Fusarium redolens]|uniref:Uncharacterized protein n=1 Tax=Fusarium redolens TaxID=48865 RepID=A0A9P9H4K3_FUSRE|nr:uncharacterized protein BKA55DRAFT_539805 [Fusarium redolens]KAH7250250.1 hypothetical protein BKA55DRAFT_539805 [Fusarium redolens]